MKVKVKMELKNLQSLEHELDDPAFNARQAAIQRSLLFRDRKIVGLMKIGIGDSANVQRIVTEIDNAPSDKIVLVFIVAADCSAKDLIHEQAAIFTRSGKIKWQERLPLCCLLTPFTKHKNLGEGETFIGIVKL